MSAEVTFDKRRGHICVKNGAGVATFVESGETLSLWTSTTVDLDPDDAIQLATALRAWVQRRATIRRGAA